MRWIRKKTPWLTRLTVFALTAQLAVSFGHMHLEACEIAPAAQIVAAAYSIAEAASPAQPGPRPATHELCAICANISLLNSLAIPVSRALPAPHTSNRIRYRPTPPREVPAAFGFSAQ